MGQGRQSSLIPKYLQYTAGTFHYMLSCCFGLGKGQRRFVSNISAAQRWREQNGTELTQARLDGVETAKTQVMQWCKPGYNTHA
jgi:hypothetical protein